MRQNSKIGFMFALSGIVAILALPSCSRKPVEIGSAKMFALSPGEYLGMSMMVSGTVKGRGPEGTYFILEDDSGKVLVSTYRIADSFSCAAGSHVKVLGKLDTVESENSYFFSADKVVECTQ